MICEVRHVETKAKYSQFCETAYVPIFSQPWWLDAVCEEQNWDVWLYEKGEELLAAMPYYKENRNGYRYITKAPLTQNNGIVFKYSKGVRPTARAKFEEKVINAACEHISSLGLAVYEQQYQTNFRNWLPFSWNGYSAIPRYTYAIAAEKGIEDAWADVSAKQRSVVKKGLRNADRFAEIDAETFYRLHEGIFARQGKACPFSEELWFRLESACRNRGCCKILSAMSIDDTVSSLIFLVWDERRMYHLLGGGIPDCRSLDTYAALIWEAIKLSRKMGLVYDFEGSMIKRISKSFREFGGEPQLYFRIRKVFEPEVVRAEAERQIARLGE